MMWKPVISVVTEIMSEHLYGIMHAPIIVIDKRYDIIQTRKRLDSLMRSEINPVQSGRRMEMLRKGLLLLLAVLILQGCNDMSKEEKETIIKEATESAIQHFKEQKGWDVVINEHEFTTRSNGSEIFLFGYQKGNEDNRIHAMVNFSGDKYEVSLIGYDEP